LDEFSFISVASLLHNLLKANGTVMLVKIRRTERGMSEEGNDGQEETGQLEEFSCTQLL